MGSIIDVHAATDPIILEKMVGSSTDIPEKREGRDKRIARERGLNIFISVNDIINIQMDEFNECLEHYKGGVPLSSLLGPPNPTLTQVIQDPETGESKSKMTEEQAVLAREIRRRGKNEKAAQDCRKRANERISQLKNDIERLRKRPKRLESESAQIAQQLRHMVELKTTMEASGDSSDEDIAALLDEAVQMSMEREGKYEKISREEGLNIFISVDDIINIQNWDEFNERLGQYKGGVLLSSLLGPQHPTPTQVIQDPETGESKAKMTEEQEVLAREIRRWGINKKAAQDCRKRANERISQLQNDVERESLRKEEWVWVEVEEGAEDGGVGPTRAAASALGNFN